MSGAFNALGSIKQGNAAYSAGMYNAQASQQEAQQALETAGSNEVAARDSFQRMQGQQVANMAANGVDTSSGSPLDVLHDSAVEAEYDALKIRYGGALRSNAFNQQAQLQQMGASQARTAGYISAAAQLAGAIDKSYNKTSSPGAMT